MYFHPSECVASLHTPLEEGKPEKQNLSVKRGKEGGGRERGWRDGEIEFLPVVGYSCGQHQVDQVLEDWAGNPVHQSPDPNISPCLPC